ncbi:MAG: alpha/beta hydrolase [Bacteroidota bacterium]|nr:alpha/beta hydrolase [Bacteroidota bacterium]
MLHYSTYTNSKSKPWVTFVHGAGGSSSIWFKQIREFSKHFNVLMVDLRGHGKSKRSFLNAFKKKYTFTSLAQDIVDVLDKEKIKSSHFVGISLGTILIRQIAETYPKRIKSMVMAGAIMKLNVRSQILMRFGNLFKSIVPYLWIYRLFAYIIMPKKNHKESRLLFVREAKKLYKKEFMRWYKLTSDLNPLLKLFRQIDIKIPTLYLMGREDYMFLPSIKQISKSQKLSQLSVVENSGHVVNVDQPIEFNNRAISFIRSL